MGKKYKEKNCMHCSAGKIEGVIETSQHWFECEAYSTLRIGLDPELVLEDRVKFLLRVQQLRKLIEKNL